MMPEGERMQVTVCTTGEKSSCMPMTLVSREEGEKMVCGSKLEEMEKKIGQLEEMGKKIKQLEDEVEKCEEKDYEVEYVVSGFSGGYNRFRLLEQDSQKNLFGGRVEVGARKGISAGWYVDDVYFMDVYTNGELSHTVARLGKEVTGWLFKYVGINLGVKLELQEEKDADRARWRFSSHVGPSIRIPIYTPEEIGTGIDITLRGAVNFFGINGSGYLDGYCGIDATGGMTFYW